MTLAARGATALVAVLALGWLAVLERDLHLQHRAQAETVDVRDPASLARADRDYRASRFLNPDRTSDVLRAYLYRLRRGAEPAVALARPLLHDEPDNLDLLILMTRSPTRQDPGLAAQARERLRSFDPALR